MKKKISLFLLLPAVAMVTAGCFGKKDTGKDQDNSQQTGGDDTGGGQQETVSVSAVSLNKSSVMLAPNETITLEATVSPADATNKAVNWSSDNESVATVNNGVVTAVAEGNATITATSQDGGKHATCNVAVVSKTSVHAGTIEDPLDKEDALRLAKWATQATSKNYFIYDEVTEVTTTESQFGTSSKGKLSFKFGDFTVYQMKRTAKMDNFDTVDDIIVGDKVLIYAGLVNYGGNTPETSGGYVVDVNPREVSSLVSVEGTFSTEVDEVIYPSDVVINAKDANGGDVQVRAHDVVVDTSAEGVVTAVAKYLNKTIEFNVEVGPKVAPIAAGNYYLTGTKDGVTYYLKANGDNLPVAVTEKENATGIAFELQEGSLTDYKLRVVGTNPAQYLYGIADNKGIKASAEKSDFIWKIEKNSTAGLFEISYVDSTQKTRYLSLYANQDFRTYVRTSVETFPGIETFVEQKVESLSVKTQPTKLTYQVGETFSLEGCVVTASYNYGSPKDIEAADLSCDITEPFVEADIAAEKTVTIFYGGKTTTVTIAVEARPEHVYVNSVTLKKDGVNAPDAETIYLPEETITLNAEVLPSNADDTSIIWGSNNESVASVENGVVTFKGVEGEVIISATANDTQNGTKSDSITLTVKKNGIKAAYLAGVAVGHNTTTEDTFEISGTVTQKLGKNWIIQDGPYAFEIYTSEEIPDIEIGKKVTFTSKAKNYNGLIETPSKPADIVVTNDGVPQLAVGIQDIATANIGCLISGEVVLTKAGNTYSTSTDNKAEFMVGEQTYTIFGSKNYLVSGQNDACKNAPVGSKIKITNGYVGINNGIRQICLTQTTITEDISYWPVTSLTLNQTEASIGMGMPLELVAEVGPENATEKTVTWSSNNEAVATVDSDGNVTAVGAGTAIITAAAGGLTATCTVTVSAKTLNSIEVTTKPKTEYVFGEKLDLTGMVVTCHYDTGDETISEGFTTDIEEGTVVTSSMNTLKVSYGGKETSVSIGLSHTKDVLTNEMLNVGSSYGNLSKTMEGTGIEYAGYATTKTTNDVKYIQMKNGNVGLYTVNSNRILKSIKITVGADQTSSAYLDVYAANEEFSLTVPDAAIRKGSINSNKTETTEEFTFDNSSVIRNFLLAARGGACYVKSIEVTYADEAITNAIDSVLLDKNELAMHVGEEETLTKTIKGLGDLGDVTWSSTDESVATVLNGTVSAVGVGSCKIIATSTKDTSVKAECSVTVAETRTLTDITSTGGFKTSYTTADEEFAIDDLVVTANYDNGDAEAVDDYTITWSSPFDATAGTHTSTPTIHWGGHDLAINEVSYSVSATLMDKMVADFTAKTAGASSYKGGEWQYGDFTINGGANNNKGWAFIKFGSKSADNIMNATVTSKATTDIVKKITINTNAGNLTVGGCTSYGVRVFKVGEPNTQVGSDVVGTTAMTKGAAQSLEIDISTLNLESGNSYIYQVYFEMTNSTGTNGIVWVDSIQFQG